MVASFCEQLARIAPAHRLAIAHRGKLDVTRDLLLGSLGAQRNRGFVGDHVEAAWLILQPSQSDDYVSAKGVTALPCEVFRIGFEHVAVEYEQYVKSDSSLMRPVRLRAAGEPRAALIAV